MSSSQLRTQHARALLLIAILALLLMSSASTAGAPRFQTSVTPASYLPLVMKPRMQQIAFTSQRDGNGEIYLMNANGSEQINLTNNPSQDRDPSWSPDGSRVLFLSNRDDPATAQIYVMRADGSNQTRLTNEPGGAHDPAWSPDGTMIAYIIIHGGHGDISVVDINGASDGILVHAPYYPFTPVWSPDGKKLAFRAGYATYVVNSDGSGQQLISDNITRFDQPWFPDSARLAFSAIFTRANCVSYPLSEIVVASADGSDQKRLTSSTAPCDAQFVKAGVAVSPDGARIKFETDDIYVLRADGSDLTNITNSPAFESASAWSMDGTMLAFYSSDANNSYGIYLVNADGSNLFRLTTNTAIDYQPVWRP
jgi:Tol biopolymer transport system component